MIPAYTEHVSMSRLFTCVGKKKFAPVGTECADNFWSLAAGLPGRSYPIGINLG